MSATVYLILSLIIAFITGLLFSRRANQKDAEIIDLTAKIKEKQNEAAKKQLEADAATQDYLDALKHYDPNFYGNDDGDNH